MRNAKLKLAMHNDLALAYHVSVAGFASEDAANTQRRTLIYNAFSISLNEFLVRPLSDAEPENI